MARFTVLIFHRPAAAGESQLSRVLSDVRSELVDRQARLFRRAGAKDIVIVDEWRPDKSFGEVLAELAPARGGVVVLSGGAVPLLNESDANLLAFTAEQPEMVALTNNRYSSDVVAMGRARSLSDLPRLPSDNALPRWLEERAGYDVAELWARQRLALDLDTPQDVALVTLHPKAPRWLRDAATAAGLEIPRLNDIRDLATSPHRELLIFGRSSSSTLRWLEKNVRCRVRFLAEERGMRASSPLAIGSEPEPRTKLRGARATLGLLLDDRGPERFGEILASLADGAIIDSRVLLAHRLGTNESGWPSPEDRFASDLQRPGEINDPWLKALTQSAAESQFPILLGGHSLVGPGVRLVLG
jgi:CTP:molybdopterin cytidylyltransferase MocA